MALGANLPGPGGRAPAATLDWAARQLGAIPGLSLVAVSRWFSSPAWPPSDQPDYVNGVARLVGAAAPEALLARLHAIEAQAGRVRGAVNAARPLDLDLLAVGSARRSGPGLVLPHPRLQDRAFVLAPLCQVAPDWVHPLLGRTPAQMLAALPDAHAARPLPQAGPGVI